jgi:hypothetical protein
VEEEVTKRLEDPRSGLDVVEGGGSEDDEGTKVVEREGRVEMLETLEEACEEEVTALTIVSSGGVGSRCCCAAITAGSQ